MQLIDPGHMTLILRHGLCPECRHTINVISKVRPRPVIGGTVIGGTVRKSAVTQICAADVAGTARSLQTADPLDGDRRFSRDGKSWLLSEARELG